MNLTENIQKLSQSYRKSIIFKYLNQLLKFYNYLKFFCEFL